MFVGLNIMSNTETVLQIDQMYGVCANALHDTYISNIIILKAHLLQKRGQT